MRNRLPSGDHGDQFADDAMPPGRPEWGFPKRVAPVGLDRFQPLHIKIVVGQKRVSEYKQLNDDWNLDQSKPKFGLLTVQYQSAYDCLFGNRQ